MHKINHLEGDDILDVSSLIEQFVSRWNTKDPQIFGQVFTDDAEFTDIVGNVAIGKDAIIQQHKFPFEVVNREAVFMVNDIYLRYLANNLVLATAYYKITNSLSPRGDIVPPFVGVIQIVCRKNAENWKVSLVNNVAVGKDYWAPGTSNLQFPNKNL